MNGALIEIVLGIITAVLFLLIAYRVKPFDTKKIENIIKPKWFVFIKIGAFYLIGYNIYKFIKYYFY